MRIRFATLEDVRGIVEIHRIGKHLKGDLYKLYSMGGPWMSVETMAIHINNLLLDNQLVAVAEIDGKIVGEVEVIFSEEPFLRRQIKIAHIDVIEVHPNYRGRGIGRSLMEFVENVASERKAQLLTVQPNEDVESFYRKLGFDIKLFNGFTVWVPTLNGHGEDGTESFEFEWRDVTNLELVAGHFQSSYSMWFSAFKDKIFGIHYVIQAGKCGESYYAFRNLPGREGVALFLWGRIEDLYLVLEKARNLGFTKVLTVLGDADVFEAKKVGKIEIIGKKVTGSILL